VIWLKVAYAKIVKKQTRINVFKYCIIRIR
jgi:hypothetical protein